MTRLNDERMAEELKSCPFTGEQPEVRCEFYSITGLWQCEIKAPYTLFSAIDETEEGCREAAVSEWNERPIEDHLLAEVKALRVEKAQAEAERDVLITLLNSGQCPYSYGYEFPDCVHITEGEESHCMGYSATKYSCWLKYAQQHAEKKGA